MSFEPVAGVAEARLVDGLAPERLKIWVLTNAPSPYQVDLLRGVHAAGKVDLHVRFMRVRAGSALETAEGPGFRWIELWGLAPKRWRDEFRLHPRAIREAFWGDFDAYILSGLYTSLTFLICAAILSIRHKAWGVWLERPRARQFQVLGRQGTHGARALQASKRSVLRWLLRKAWRVIGIGSEAAREYRRLGADDRKVLMLPYCCDVKRFQCVEAAGVRAVRQRYHLDGKTVYLFSGQMIERKGVDVLLAAFRPLAEANSNVALLLLGSGPHLESYRHCVPEGLRSRVCFTGLLPQSELPAHFAAADVFVFPSRHDGWGVVINEACAAGLPVITSRQTGASFDLVCDGENGFVLDSEDVSGLTARMRYFVDHPEQIARFGARSRELVGPFSAEAGARVFADHARSLIGGHKAATQ